MLVPDPTAFVEEIAVTIDDKRLDRLRRRARNAELEVLQAMLEVRVLEETAKAMERALAGADDSDDSAPTIGAGRTWSRRGPIANRDINTLRVRISKKRQRLAAKNARAAALEAEARELGLRATTVTAYRLHSQSHHLDRSEYQYARQSTAQQVRPVWVTTVNGRRWWWYLDRFWWDDEHLDPDQVRQRVLERDAEERRRRAVREQARAEKFARAPRQKRR
jgi:hypothetical protein